MRTATLRLLTYFNIPSGVAMGWNGQGGQSPGATSAGATEFRAKKLKNNISVLEKIRTSGYQTLECFIATPGTDLQILGALPPNAFCVNCTRLVAGLSPDPLREL